MPRTRFDARYTQAQSTILYGSMLSSSTLMMMVCVLRFKSGSLPILFLVFTGVLILAISACIYCQSKYWKNQHYFKRATNIAMSIMLVYLALFMYIFVF